MFFCVKNNSYFCLRKTCLVEHYNSTFVNYKTTNMDLTLTKPRRFFVSALLITLGCNAPRAEIVITTETETSVRIADITDITFQGNFQTGSLQVNYADGTSAFTPIASIRKITFQPDAQEDAITPTTDVPVISIHGDLLFIHCKGGSMTLHSAEGKHIMAARLKNGINAFSLSSLPHGVYVLRANGHQVKFLKK